MERSLGPEANRYGINKSHGKVWKNWRSLELKIRDTLKIITLRERNASAAGGLFDHV